MLQLISQSLGKSSFGIISKITSTKLKLNHSWLALPYLESLEFYLQNFTMLRTLQKGYPFLGIKRKTYWILIIITNLLFSLGQQHHWWTRSAKYGWWVHRPSALWTGSPQPIWELDLGFSNLLISQTILKLCQGILQLLSTWYVYFYYLQNKSRWHFSQ